MCIYIYIYIHMYIELLIMIIMMIKVMFLWGDSDGTVPLQEVRYYYY